MKARRSIFNSLIVILTFTLASPGMAWEESDKRAFEEKIGIMAELIKGHHIDSKDPAKAVIQLRTQCLLQSIGIDVATRYLEYNPGDQWWKKKYSELRDSLTLCLGYYYHQKKALGLD